METNTKADGTTMTDDEARAFIASLTFEDVRSVYSGKQGCMCGCRGKHRYNPKHLVEASEDRGYDISKEEINLLQVKKVLNFLKADPRTCVQDGYILYIPKHQEPIRNYCVYLCKSKMI
jgi:hypothetical protein